METAASGSDMNINHRIQDVWTKLKETQKVATQFRAQWLESVARHKAVAEGQEDSSKVLSQMVTKPHTQQMHQKLSGIMKGAHGGLDYIEVPTAEWYYSLDKGKLS